MYYVVRTNRTYWLYYTYCITYIMYGVQVKTDAIRRNDVFQKKIRRYMGTRIHVHTYYLHIIRVLTTHLLFVHEYRYKRNLHDNLSNTWSSFALMSGKKRTGGVAYYVHGYHFTRIRRICIVSLSVCRYPCTSTFMALQWYLINRYYYGKRGRKRGWLSITSPPRTTITSILVLSTRLYGT